MDLWKRSTKPVKENVDQECVGATGSLVLTLYAPEFQFDKAGQQWKTDQALGYGTAARDQVAGRTRVLEKKMSCAEVDEFFGALGDSRELEEPEAQVAPAPPPWGVCGWGPGNLSDTSNGCGVLRNRSKVLEVTTIPGVARHQTSHFRGADSIRLSSMAQVSFTCHPISYQLSPAVLVFK